ncbi:MAG: D-glycero-beta-D-manno-heptose 1-phosphate adenylyltransferase [Pseudomonadota bacterium]
MTEQNLSALIDASSTKKIICIGDTMLDRFVYGSVDRISPEAPVPVFKQTRVTEMPGGAGNVARNVAALGAQAVLIGVVGDDDEARRLVGAIGDMDGVTGDLIAERGRPTTLKTRYVATAQQMLRVDSENTAPIDRATEQAVIDSLTYEAKTAQAILFSDYAKGVATPAILEAVAGIGREHGIPIIVDPKGRDFGKYGSVTLIKPNASELAAATELPCGSDQDVAAALEAAKNASSATAIVATRAAKGMSYINANDQIVHVQGEAREVYDVSGAGDTSLAALGIGLASNGTLEQAIALAIRASGIAVGKAGTAAVTAAELRESLQLGMARLGGVHTPLDALLTRVDGWRDAGLTIGFTNGCFDILHPGHLKVLEEARERCGRLIVGLNSDASVRRLKGETRPVNNEASRARVLSALSVVDDVIVFEEDTPANLIDALKPDLLVKGGDYALDDIVGARDVLERGGAVHIVPLVEGESTTSAIARAKGNT